MNDLGLVRPSTFIPWKKLVCLTIELRKSKNTSNLLELRSLHESYMIRPNQRMVLSEKLEPKLLPRSFSVTLSFIPLVIGTRRVQLFVSSLTGNCRFRYLWDLLMGSNIQLHIFILVSWQHLSPFDVSIKFHYHRSFLLRFSQSSTPRGRNGEILPLVTINALSHQNNRCNIYT